MTKVATDAPVMGPLKQPNSASSRANGSNGAPGRFASLMDDLGPPNRPDPGAEHGRVGTPAASHRDTRRSDNRQDAAGKARGGDKPDAAEATLADKAEKVDQADPAVAIAATGKDTQPDATVIDPAGPFDPAAAFDPGGPLGQPDSVPAGVVVPVVAAAVPQAAAGESEDADADAAASLIGPGGKPAKSAKLAATMTMGLSAEKSAPDASLTDQADAAPAAKAEIAPPAKAGIAPPAPAEAKPPRTEKPDFEKLLAADDAKPQSTPAPSSPQPSAPQRTTDLQAAPAAQATAAAPPAAAPAVTLAALPVEIATRAHEGRNRFEIRLDPPDLGRIDVRLDIDRHGNVSSRLMVERADTLDLLRRDAHQLERALQDAGLKTSDSGLQFSLRDQGFAGRDNAPAPTPAAQILVADHDAPRIDASPYRPSVRLGALDIRI